MESTVKDNFESHLYFKRTKHFSKKHAFLEVIKCNVTKFKTRKHAFMWRNVTSFDCSPQVCIYFFVITSKIHPSTEIRDKNLISSKVVTFLYVLRSYATRRKKIIMLF